jgi:hypothetical protein
MRIVLAALLVTIASCAVTGDDYDPAGERAAAQGKADGPAVPKKKWTFLFYGAGDNNLGDEVIGAVENMEAVGSTADVNLLAFYDHPALGAARVYLEKDADLTKISSPGISQLGVVDSGNPHTLIDFSVWAINTYPADHYALIIDGHGGGSPQQIAFDDSSQHAMSLADLWQATDYIRQRTHQPLALLGGDTCLTQTVEQAVELHEDVDSIAMSQNVDYGWDYTAIVSGLVAKPEQSTQEFSTAMVKAYGDHLAAMPSLTMAALDTKSMLDVEAGLSLMGDALHDFAARSPEARQQVAEAIAAAYRPEYGTDFVDLRNLTSLLAQHTQDADIAYVAGELDTLAQKATYASYISPDIAARSHGLSVFLPQTLTEDTLAGYRTSKLAHDSTWDEFVAWWNGLQ